MDHPGADVPAYRSLLFNHTFKQSHHNTITLIEAFFKCQQHCSIVHALSTYINKNMLLKDMMWKRTILIITLFLIVMLLISGLASANPVAFNPVENTLIWFVFLFTMNLPLNSLMYISLLFCYLYLQNDRESFLVRTEVFFDRVVAVTVLATMAGTFIDAMVLTLTFYDFFIFDDPTFILIGLTMIFFSYYFFIRFVQKLNYKPAFLISLGISIFNGIAWLTLLGITDIMPAFFLIAICAGYCGFVIVYASFYWLYTTENKRKLCMLLIETHDP